MKIIRIFICLTIVNFGLIVAKGQKLSIDLVSVVVDSNNYSKLNLNINKQDGWDATVSFGNGSYLWDISHKRKYKIIGLHDGNNKKLYLNRSYSIKGKKGTVYKVILAMELLHEDVNNVDVYVNANDNWVSWMNHSVKISTNNRMESDWTEANLKDYLDKDNIQEFEGIYDAIYEEGWSKYKLAVKYNNVNNKYNLIYISGSVGTNWKEGDIKAELKPTSTAGLFNSIWYMENKAVTDLIIVSIYPGSLKVLDTEDNTEQSYLKIYPLATNTNTDGNSNVGGSGTGFAISSAGYIATNYHVVENAKEINIRGVDGNFTQTYKANVILTDKNNDLAILQIPDFTFKTLVPYIFADKSIDVGEKIYVIGYPLRALMGDDIKLTDGIVSSKSGFQGDITSYQVTAPAHPGNSGGPLFNEKGLIVGIVTAKLGGVENTTYAIKSSYLIPLFEQVPGLLVSSSNTISNLSLTEQFKKIKNCVFIIEVK